MSDFLFENTQRFLYVGLQLAYINEVKLIIIWLENNFCIKIGKIY